jgi:ASC-1-like (ASCH) protein
MDHVAIMKKSWGLLEKIRSDDKKIESRWSMNKCVPWGMVDVGDVIFFKNSGEPVRLKASVSKVKAYTNLTPKLVKQILKKYGKLDGIDSKEINKFYGFFKNKKYCQLIFLRNPKNVRSFEIDKRGFGAMAAWLSVENIDTIKT